MTLPAAIVPDQTTEVLGYMEMALEAGAFKSLQALVTAFAPSLRASTDDKVRSEIQKLDESLSRTYLKAVFNESDLPEQGPSYLLRAIEQFIDAAGLAQETSYITDGTFDSPVGRLRHFHAARDVDRALQALAELAEAGCSMSHSENEQVDKIVEDLSIWKDFEERHGRGAALNLEHPYNRNIMRLFRANPSIQDIRFQVASQKGEAFQLEGLG